MKQRSSGQRGIVLLLVIVLIGSLTWFAPNLLDGLDPRFGSVVMVLVFVAAIGIWLKRRNAR